VFAYMPPLISDTINITSSQVFTDSLEAYQPEKTANSADILAVYLAYIPSTHVDALSAAVKAPNSPFYTKSSGIARDLANVVNPTLPITSYAAQGVSNSVSTDPGVAGTSSNQTSSSESKSDDKKRTIIIAVTTVFGVLIAAALAYFAFTKARKSSKNGSGKGRAVAGASSPGLRPFRLTQGAAGLAAGGGDTMRQRQGPSPTTGWWQTRPTSATSSFSSGSEDSQLSSEGSVSEGYRRAHTSGRSSSIDFASVGEGDVRNSWWRFSDGYGRAFGGPVSGSVSPVSPRSAGRQSTNRRINIQRTAGGNLAGISRPTMQENSLML
jgi:hypothetical protein